MEGVIRYMIGSLIRIIDCIRLKNCLMADYESPFVRLCQADAENALAMNSCQFLEARSPKAWMNRKCRHPEALLPALP